VNNPRKNGILSIATLAMYLAAFHGSIPAHIFGVEGCPVAMTTDSHDAVHKAASLIALGGFGFVAEWALFNAVPDSLAPQAKLLAWLLLLSYSWGFVAWWVRRHWKHGRMDFWAVFGVGCVLMLIATAIGWRIFPPHPDAGTGMQERTAAPEMVCAATPLLRPFKAGDNLQINLPIKNFCDTAKQLIGVGYSIRISAQKSVDYLQEHQSQLKRIATQIGPTNWIPPKESHGFVGTCTEPITDQQFQDILAGKQLIYVIAAILYRDGGGISRSSSSCFKFDTKLNAFALHRDVLNQSSVREDLSKLQIQKRSKLEALAVFVVLGLDGPGSRAA